MLDTERNVVVPQIVDEYEFKYCDNNQEAMCSEVGFIFGNIIDLENKYNNRDVILRFDLYSDLKVLVEYHNEEDKEKLINLYDIKLEEIIENKIIIFHLGYSGNGIYDKIKEEILDAGGILSKLP